MQLCHLHNWASHANENACRLNFSSTATPLPGISGAFSLSPFSLPRGIRQPHDFDTPEPWIRLSDQLINKDKKL